MYEDATPKATVAKLHKPSGGHAKEGRAHIKGSKRIKARGHGKPRKRGR